MSKKCRLWWPENLSITDTPTSVFLFGWIVSSSSDSLDIVVAFACSVATFLSNQSDVQEILDEISRQMPKSLQDKCTLSLLGHCAVDLTNKTRLPTAVNEECSQMNCTIDGLFDISKLVSLERNNWIQLLYKKLGSIDRNIKSVPTLHHMHFSGEILSQIELHVILYETPIFGSHHFSPDILSSEQVITLEVPMWLQALHQKQTVVDLETVVLAINSAHAAKSCFGRSVGPKRADRLPILFMCVTLTRQLLAVFIASLSTLLYIILLVLHVILSYGSKSWMYLTLGKLFGNTWKNIRIRCCQIIYWPAILGDNGLRSQPCVEYAEKAAIHRYSMWSSIAIDVLLGNILGTTLYFYAESVFVWISKLIDDITDDLLHSVCMWLMGVPAGFELNTAYDCYLFSIDDIWSQSCVEYAEKAAIHRHSMWSSIAIDVLLGNILGTSLYFYAESVSVWISKLIDDITDDLLRSGCVWLMGVPAGFKLNTELAGVLGMICLNAIQTWSTLCFFLSPPCIYFVKGVAISAIIFGLTTPAAFIMDTISLATLHVIALHWLISRIYSLQLQAITALWRLFRGRKSNPLRHRYDSYDYSVEQHIVGSLLFTPILLLLPTTSVFYIFFTIMKSTISFTCIAIEVIISLIHATPYLKIFHWLTRPKRFPSGLWFDIRVYRSKSDLTCQSMDAFESRSSTLISFLRSNNLNLREIVLLHYKQSFSVVSSSLVASTVRGILIGKSIPSTLGIGLPSTMPWMFIPYKDYWHLCHESILGCPKNRRPNALQKAKKKQLN